MDGTYNTYLKIFKIPQKIAFQRITAKVEINDDFPSEYFRVKYFSKCYDNGVETERDTCENIQASTVIK